MSDFKPVVALIGAGPAGVSAALWLADFDVPFVWMDSSGEVGGLLQRVHNEIGNFPGGFYADGSDLVARLRDQIATRGIELQKAKVLSIASKKSKEGHLHLQLERHSIITQRVIVATGTRYRKLQIPGEDEGLGKWVSQSAAADAERVAGQNIAVVGGGDAGFENALRLADVGCKVSLLLRNYDFSARPSFVRQVQENSRITIAPIPSLIRRIEPTDTGCRLLVDSDGEERMMEFAALFVRIGVEPQIPDGLEELDRNPDGFLQVDRHFRTSDPAIFAIGDVIATSLRAVATAVGNGAVAARTCASDLHFL